MKKIHYILIGIVLLVLCIGTVLLMGDTYTWKVDVSGEGSLDDYEVLMSEPDESDYVKLIDKKLDGQTLTLTFQAAEPGKALVFVRDPADAEDVITKSRMFYSHKGGILTADSFMGGCEGGLIFPAAILLYMILLFAGLAKDYRAGMRRSLYQYRNVLRLGMLIFLGFLIVLQTVNLVTFRDLNGTANLFLGSANAFAQLVLPIAFVLSILITASNIYLMRKEGRTWRNMLGTILGVLLLFGTVFPLLLGNYLQWSSNPIFDVHNMNGAGLYIENFVEAMISSGVTYLECILLATIILSVRAARHVPAFDKDYILILGCQIAKDGSLTNLLRGRVDRALEFAKLQKEAGGKEIVFVPSGGQGSDEIIAEAAAMRNYLTEEAGIPAERILVEDQSVNTEENMRRSMALIQEKAGADEPKVAFSTTNYHVFRSGILAFSQGINAEGIGAPTKRYFWINAFVREFIATIAEEKKTHIRVAVLLLVAIAILVLVQYFNNTL